MNNSALSESLVLPLIDNVLPWGRGGGDKHVYIAEACAISNVKSARFSYLYIVIYNYVS